MAIKYRELERILRRLGLSVARQRGTHQTWVHPDIQEPLTGIVYKEAEVRDSQWSRVRKWLARHQLIEE